MLHKGASVRECWSPGGPCCVSTLAATAALLLEILHQGLLGADPSAQALASDQWVQRGFEVPSSCHSPNLWAGLLVNAALSHLLVANTQPASKQLG